MTSESVFHCQLCRAEIPAGEGLCESCRTNATIVAENADELMAGRPEHFGKDIKLPATGEGFGDYEILEEIARGGMGVVYKARQNRLNRTVAIKVILGGRFSSQEDKQRFQMEARSAAKLDHPAIIPVYDISEHDGQPYFAMKYVAGGSLLERLDEFRGNLTSGVQILETIALAVNHAHQRGILHRDLKPENILLDKNGAPLLTDLGLAKETSGSSGITQTGALLGTPRHMAPEQAEPGRTVTTAADIYALGTILYQLLTGRTPHQGDSPMETLLQVLQQPVEAPSAVESTVDPSLELICQKCLQRDPDQRYRSAADLAEDLECWRTGKPISVKPPSFLSRAADWVRRNKPLVYAALAIIAACLLSFPLLLSLLGALPDPDGLYLGTDYDQRPWLYEVSAGISTVSPIFGLILLVFWLGLGLLIVGVTRPKSIRKASVYGFVAGGTSAALIYVTLGWAIFSVTSQAAINPGVRVLAAASLSDNQQTADQARVLLMASFPKLRELPANQHVNYVADRIFADGIAVGPRALLGTILGAIILLTPIVGGAIIAWVLSQRNHRWWFLTLRYGLSQLVFFTIVVTFAAIFTGGQLNGQQWADMNFPTQVACIGLPPAILALLMHRWKTRTKTVSEKS